MLEEKYSDWIKGINDGSIKITPEQQKQLNKLFKDYTEILISDKDNKLDLIKELIIKGIRRISDNSI